MIMRILLVEPNYKNKYPPMGLMKISTYHKGRGDEVAFYKGVIDRKSTRLNSSPHLNLVCRLLLEKKKKKKNTNK